MGFNPGFKGLKRTGDDLKRKRGTRKRQKNDSREEIKILSLRIIVLSRRDLYLL